MRCAASVATAPRPGEGPVDHHGCCGPVLRQHVATMEVVVAQHWGQSVEHRQEIVPASPEAVVPLVVDAVEGLLDQGERPGGPGRLAGHEAGPEAAVGQHASHESLDEPGPGRWTTVRQLGPGRLSRGDSHPVVVVRLPRLDEVVRHSLHPDPAAGRRLRHGVRPRSPKRRRERGRQVRRVEGCLASPVAPAVRGVALAALGTFQGLHHAGPSAGASPSWPCPRTSKRPPVVSMMLSWSTASTVHRSRDGSARPAASATAAISAWPGRTSRAGSEVNSSLPTSSHRAAATKGRRPGRPPGPVGPRLGQSRTVQVLRAIGAT